MGELSGVVARLLPPDKNFMGSLLEAEQIEIIYTPRLKNKFTQWLVQLRCNGKVEAIAHAPSQLTENQAYGLLVKESKDLAATLKVYLPTFNAPMIGYYHMGNGKEHNFGKLR